MVGNEDAGVGSTDTSGLSEQNEPATTETEIESLPETAATSEESLDANLNTSAEPALEEPVVAENGFDEPATTPTENPEQSVDQGFDTQASDPNANLNPDQGIGSIPENLNTQIQEAGGSFQKMFMGMDQKMMENVGIGLGGAVLLLVILRMVNRRRQYARATQVQEFDFTGSTKIDEQTKTHIDI
jgi:hypothetical protein